MAGDNKGDKGKDKRNEFVGYRPATPDDWALVEFSKNEMLQAIPNVADFSKSMITLVSGFFVAYFALLKFLGLENNTQLSTLIDPYTAIIAPMLFIISIIAFVVSYAPAVRKVESITNLTSIENYRKRLLKIKYIPTVVGMAFFIAGLGVICMQILF